MLTEVIGRRCTVNDLCNRTTNRLRRVRAGLYKTHPDSRRSLMKNLVQTYTDLRQLRVENVVEAILGD